MDPKHGLSITTTDTENMTPEQVEELREMGEAVKVAAMKIAEKYGDYMGQSYMQGDHLAAYPPEWICSARIVQAMASTATTALMSNLGPHTFFALLMKGELEEHICEAIAQTAHQTFWMGYYYRQNVVIRAEEKREFDHLVGDFDDSSDDTPLERNERGDTSGG